jgi:hypothetical protein
MILCKWHYGFKKSSSSALIDPLDLYICKLTKTIFNLYHILQPLLNVACCLLILLGHSIQRRVFGNLRASEQESIKDQFWNLVFYKVVFVFGVVHVQDVEDAVGWCIFVSLIGFLQLARQLCQDRHNYVSYYIMISLST